MSERQTFPLGDVLSVTTGILVGPSHVDGIYRVVDFMEGYPHFTHGLPDAADRVTPHIIRQVPELAEAHPPPIASKEDADEWVASVAAYIGRDKIELVPVAPRESREDKTDD